MSAVHFNVLHFYFYIFLTLLWQHGNEIDSIKVTDYRNQEDGYGQLEITNMLYKLP